MSQGQSAAFTGHNGSGKSTLLRLIGGLTNPTSGRIQYVRPLKINYIPEHFPKMGITSRRYILHMGLLEGMKKKEIQEKSSELFGEFFMESMQDIPMKHLSKGTLQKVDVIQALLSRPDVLLLDEPLSRQAAGSQNVFIAKVRELNSHGVTILMSCHENFLINRISDRVYEIRDGCLNAIALDGGTLAEYDIVIVEQGYPGSGLPYLRMKTCLWKS